MCYYYSEKPIITGGASLFSIRGTQILGNIMVPHSFHFKAVPFEILRGQNGNQK